MADKPASTGGLTLGARAMNLGGGYIAAGLMFDGVKAIRKQVVRTGSR